MVNKNICKQYLNHYGTDYTLTVAMEEPAELIHAIAHLRRDGLNPFRKVELAQAIADVMICIEYLMQLYSVPEKEIQDKIDFKQQRTVKRLSDDGRA